MTLIIGEDVRVAAARDSVLLGLKGKVVMETMNTFTIKTDAKRNVTIPKLGSALELSSGQVVLGEDVKGRLEDRVGVSAGTRTRGARRTR